MLNHRVRLLVVAALIVLGTEPAAAGGDRGSVGRRGPRRPDRAQSERWTAGQIQAPANRVKSSRRRVASIWRVRWRRPAGFNWRA